MLSKRVRQWVFFAVGIPVAAWAMERLGDRLEENKGESQVSRGLQAGGSWLHRHERGPAARRGRR